MWTRHGDCNHCGWCCQAIGHIALNYQMGPSSDVYFYQVRGFKFDHIGKVMSKERAVIYDPCPQHDVDKLRCKIYENRPKTCQEFPTKPELIQGSPCCYWFTRATQDGRTEYIGGEGSPYPGHRVLECSDPMTLSTPTEQLDTPESTALTSAGSS